MLKYPLRSFNLKSIIPVKLLSPDYNTKALSSKNCFCFGLRNKTESWYLKLYTEYSLREEEGQCVAGSPGIFRVLKMEGLVLKGEGLSGGKGVLLINFDYFVISFREW